MVSSTGSVSMATISASGSRSSTRRLNEPGPQPRSSSRGEVPAKAASASTMAAKRSSRSGTCSCCCASQRCSQCDQGSAFKRLSLLCRAMADSRFQAAYLGGTAPWDIGRPQADFVRLLDSGAVSGDVLDVGCGTGENALYAASLGLEVTGIDAAPAAIDVARRKADVRGVAASFVVGGVLDLDASAAGFD